MLKRRLCPALSVVDEGQASLAAAAGADDLEDDDVDRDLESAIGVDDVERVGAKRCLHYFQDSFSAKKRKVPGTVAEALKLATKFVNQKAPADARSTELVSMKEALATVQAEAKKDRDRLALLLQQHEKLENDLCRGFNKVQESWKEKVEAWREKTLTAENTLNNIRFAKSERAEKFLGERDAASARLHDDVSALQWIIKLRKEGKRKGS